MLHLSPPSPLNILDASILNRSRGLLLLSKVPYRFFHWPSCLMGTGSSSSGSRWPGHVDLYCLDEWMELYLQLHICLHGVLRANLTVPCEMPFFVKDKVFYDSLYWALSGNFLGYPGYPSAKFLCPLIQKTTIFMLKLNKIGSTYYSTLRCVRTTCRGKALSITNYNVCL
jgi:hypothetical protein